jgi:hypothetical protein
MTAPVAVIWLTLTDATSRPMWKSWPQKAACRRARSVLSALKRMSR